MVKVSSTVERSSTTAGAWKRLFQGGETAHRRAACVRVPSSAAGPLWINVRPRFADAPTEPTDAADESHTDYLAYPGDTRLLDLVGGHDNDVYVRDPNGGTVAYRAWELI